jgi:NAD(P)-dependent dehydrogenase (short-subunit alcohol dehydrogenase family)
MGMGRATAVLLAARGAKVVVSDVREDAGHETVTKIEADGGAAVFVRADVSKQAGVEALVAAIDKARKVVARSRSQSKQTVPHFYLRMSVRVHHLQSRHRPVRRHHQSAQGAILAIGGITRQGG